MMLSGIKVQSLMALQVVLLLPLWRLFPIWVALISCAAMLDRLLVTQGMKKTSSSFWKVGWVLIASIALVLEYQSLLLIEPWVALLMLMYASKSLELNQTRDAFQILHLSYIVMMAQFLYDQSMLAALYALLGIALTTLVSVQVNSARVIRPQALIGRGAKILALAFPAFLVLFLFLPRLPPLWAVPQPSMSAKTGLSDRLSMGSIGRLIEDDTLALRVAFDGLTPPLATRYIRAYTLTEFDGRTWQIDQAAKRLSRRWQAAEDQSLGYQLILEPNGLNVLPYLEYLDGVYPLGVQRLSDDRLRARAPFNQRAQFSLNYRETREVASSLTSTERERLTAIDPKNHPRLVSWIEAQAMDRQSPGERIRTLRRFFLEGEFRYSLTPPRALGDPVDDFLFVTRSGFCEHFASAMAAMARLSDLPARVVTGYQGGRYNEMGGYVEFRQYDAHAWVEIWIEGEGWRRVDPTTFVSPERINEGLQALSQLPGFQNANWAWYRRLDGVLAAEFVLTLTAIQHYWDQRVLNFDRDDQVNLVRWFSPELDASDTVHIALGALIVLFVVIAFFESLRGANRRAVSTAALDRLAILRGARWIEPRASLLATQPIDRLLTMIPSGPASNLLESIIADYQAVYYAGREISRREFRLRIVRWQWLAIRLRLRRLASPLFFMTSEARMR
ncbi:MAG: transglutaminaseTgpA domain-containing protein [Pseudomonadales bacterium]|jgi:transglutaminase-like putative cysteine protease